MMRARFLTFATTFLLAIVLLASLGNVTTGMAFADDATTNNSSASPTNDTQTGNTGNGAQKANENTNESSVELDIEKNAIKENQVPDSSFIYDTSLADLANADIYYDGTTVQVVGEAVGDLINEESPGSDYKWVTLWDNNSTIDVYMSKKDADLIDTFGSNHRTGTKLQVRGVFHLTCDEHNGISDLHAENVTVQEKGRSTTSQFSIMEFIPGIVALAIGFGLLFLFNRLRNRNV